MACSWQVYRDHPPNTHALVHHCTLLIANLICWQHDSCKKSLDFLQCWMKHTDIAISHMNGQMCWGEIEHQESIHEKRDLSIQEPENPPDLPTYRVAAKPVHLSEPRMTNVTRITNLCSYVTCVETFNGICISKAKFSMLCAILKFSTLV